MSPIGSRPLLAALLALSIASPALALDVHIVDDDGFSDATDIQSAIDAAADGDVIFVRGGKYSGFTVDGKSLWIVRVGETSCFISGNSVITNLAIDQRVVVSGLRFSAGASFTAGLGVFQNLGHVRVVDCIVFGKSNFFQPGADGGPAVAVDQSRAVTFANCAFTGGTGGYSWGAPAGRGAPALVSDLSTPALYDCTLVGGKGGAVEIGATGGPGGAGCHVQSRSVFFSAGSIRGGNGGDAHSETGGEPGGSGGNGVIVDAGAAAQFLEATLSGGAGGVSFYGPEGAPGPPSSGPGTITQLQETARILRANLLVPQSTLVDLEVFGAPGDRVFLGTSMSPGFAPSPAALGFKLVAPTTRFSRRPLGTIPSTGMLSVQVPMLEIGPQIARPLFGQAIILDADNRVVMSGPVHFLVANCPMLQPDCNGNGSWDFCDLALGSSQDSNDNDIIDDCEFTQITHVDANAPSAGDGSAAHPFQTIQEGVDGSPDYQVVRVHDGVYGGFFNRNIDLEDRVLHIESANGPANCIIDLEDDGIAFFIEGLGIEPIRIAGFTIVNGRWAAFPGAVAGGIDVSHSDPTIENCTFENCRGSQAGAIAGRSTSVRIRSCRFVDNQSTNGAGAVALDPAFSTTGGPVEIVDSYFSGNIAGQDGGAVRLVASDFQEARMTHCIVTSNSAASVGGGISVRTIGGQAGIAVRIENCRITGNTASIGGGVSFSDSGGPITNPVKAMRNCTVVGNIATNHGGGVSARTFLIGNSVVWGNSAPLGAQVSVPNFGTLSVRHSDVQGGQAAVHLVAGAGLTWGAGNIDLDPLFVDADGLDNTLATFDDNDYRLGAGSPCVDAGNNTMQSQDFFDLDGDSITNEQVPFDLDFLPRLIGALIDMGAYEKQP